MKVINKWEAFEDLVTAERVRGVWSEKKLRADGIMKDKVTFIDGLKRKQFSL